MWGPIVDTWERAEAQVKKTRNQGRTGRTMTIEQFIGFATIGVVLLVVGMMSYILGYDAGEDE